MLRSPKEGLSAGTWRQKVVVCPRRGNDPANGHPRVHQPPLGRGIPHRWLGMAAWTHLANGEGMPSSAWTRRGEVKQGKSGGSIGTTDQGNGKGRSGERRMGTTAYGGKGQGKGKGGREGRLGQGGRGRSQGGERPMGMASCQNLQHPMSPPWLRNQKSTCVAAPLEPKSQGLNCAHRLPLTCIVPRQGTRLAKDEDSWG